MASALLSGGGHTACQLVVALCLRIVAAFATHQWTALCLMAGVYKFIMPSSGSEAESESADFFTNPSETVRLQDFENCNNTIKNTY